MKTWPTTITIHVHRTITLGVLIVLALCANGCVVSPGGYDRNYYGGGGYYSSYDEYYRVERPGEWQRYQAERARRLEAERRAGNNAAELRRLQQQRTAWERQQQQSRQQQYQRWQSNHQGQRPAAQPTARPNNNRLERAGRSTVSKPDTQETNDIAPSTDRPARRW
ncbi:MAG: hypothetical protein LBH14_06345 [Desulfobulbaceae bacterium]|nr:hypothetical protein [Desulfobulbaceae bacterium]